MIRLWTIFVVLSFPSAILAECGQLCTDEFWETATPEVIAEHISAADNVNDRDVDGFTPLHHVITEPSRWRYIQNLVDAGADVNEQLHSDSGEGVHEETYATLHIFNSAWVSVPSGELLAALKMIVDAGADVTAQKHSGESIVHLATQYGDPEIMHYVMSLPNVNINAEDNYGAPPAHYAVNGSAKHTLEMLKLLESYGAQINKRSSDTTIMHRVAVNLDDSEMYKELLLYLMENGIDINATDSKGRTPLHDMRGRNGTTPRTDTIPYYLDLGADPCIADNEGEIAAYANGRHNPEYLNSQKDDPNYQRLLAASGNCDLSFRTKIRLFFD